MTRLQGLHHLRMERSVLPYSVLSLLGFAARVLFLHLTGTWGTVINNDAHEYNQIASSILAGYGFAVGPGQPTAFRPLGYPYFLAALYGLCGRSVAVVQLAQALLGALSVLPTYALTRRLFGSAPALVAGIGVALHPILLYLTALITADVLGIGLQMLLLWIAFRATTASDAQVGWWVVFGVVATLSTLVRPEMSLLPWLLALGYCVSRGCTAGRIKRLLITCVACTVLALLPTFARNAVHLGVLSPFPTEGGVTFWGGNNPMASGGWTMPSPGSWQDASPPPAGVHGWPDLPERESQTRFYRAALTWIRENPGEALALVPRKLARSWTLTYGDEARSETLPPIAHVANLVFGACALVGIVLAAWSQRRDLWVFLAPLAIWIVKTVVFYGSTRLTASVLPIACMLAAHAGVSGVRWVSRIVPRRQAGA